MLPLSCYCVATDGLEGKDIGNDIGTRDRPKKEEDLCVSVSVLI